MGVRLAGPPPRRVGEARERCCPSPGRRPRARRLAAAGVGAGVVDGLIDEGTLETVPLTAEPVAEPPDPAFGQGTLSDGQRAAADAL